MAVDGTVLNLPQSDKLLSKYPLLKSTETTSMVRARLVMMCNVQSGLVTSSRLDSFKVGEKSIVRGMFDDVPEGSILLADRGFPSYSFFCSLMQRKADFCVRLPSSYLVVRAFLESGKSSEVVDFSGKKTPPIQLRLVRVPSQKAGEPDWVLATSIFDETITAQEFGELYHMRWRIEELCKDIKCKLGVEEFTGRSIHAVEQDIFANILLLNIYTLFNHTANLHIKEVSGGKAQVNAKKSIDDCRRGLILLIAGQFAQMLNSYAIWYTKRLNKNQAAVRAGRKAPRKPYRKQIKASCYRR
jgi:hypothetical protein